MNDQKEKTVKTTYVYKGRVISFETNEVICPNGATSIREIVRHPGGACILGIIDGKVILERQYRYPYDDFVYELPAGKLEKNEDPKVAAMREFEEETGYKVDSLEFYGMMYPSVGYTDEIIYLYVAHGLTKTKQHFDADEQLDICLFSLNEIQKMIENNEIRDAKTLVLILRYLQRSK